MFEGTPLFGALPEHSLHFLHIWAIMGNFLNALAHPIPEEVTNTQVGKPEHFHAMAKTHACQMTFFPFPVHC